IAYRSFYPTKTVNDAVAEFEAAWTRSVEKFTEPPNLEQVIADTPLRYQAELREKLEAIDKAKRSKFPRIKLAIDDFSGYSVFLSEEFRSRVKGHNEEFAKRFKGENVYLHLVNDKADCKARMKAPQSREIPLAVFTIDAFLNNAAGAGGLPGSIVMMIDE